MTGFVSNGESLVVCTRDGEWVASLALPVDLDALHAVLGPLGDLYDEDRGLIVTGETR